MDLGKDVMDLADAMGDVADGHSYDVVLNSLVYMLAHGGFHCGLNKEEFLARVTEQLGMIYDAMKMDNDASTSISMN